MSSEGGKGNVELKLYKYEELEERIYAILEAKNKNN